IGLHFSASVIYSSLGNCGYVECGSPAAAFLFSSPSPPSSGSPPKWILRGTEFGPLAPCASTAATPLKSTLPDDPANVDSKRLTILLSPLDATLTGNRGWGHSLNSANPTCSQLRRNIP